MNKIKFKLKLILKPKNATPTPPIAPILGQYGINLIEFCKKFNDLTKNLISDIIHIKIIIYINNNYEIILGNYPLIEYIKKIKNIKKFSKDPGKRNEFFLTVNEINIISIERNKIEKKKIYSVRKMITGTLISIGTNYDK